MSRVLMERAEALPVPKRARPTLREMAYRADRRGLFYRRTADLAAPIGQSERVTQQHLALLEAEGLIERRGRHPRNSHITVWWLKFSDHPPEESDVLAPSFESREAPPAPAKIAPANVDFCAADRRFFRPPYTEEPIEPRGADVVVRERAREAPEPVSPSVPTTPPVALPASAAAPALWLDEVRRQWVGRGACSPAEAAKALAAAGGDGDRILRGLIRALPDLRRDAARGKPRDLRWWLHDEGWKTGEAEAERAERMARERALAEESGTVPAGPALSRSESLIYEAFVARVADGETPGAVWDDDAMRPQLTGPHRTGLRRAILTRWPEARPGRARDQILRR